MRDLGKERYFAVKVRPNFNNIYEPFKDTTEDDKLNGELIDDNGNVIEKVLENKIIALDEEWQRFKGSLDKVYQPSKIPKNKLNSLLDQVSESRMRSEKQQTKGDATYLYDKLTGSSKKTSISSNMNKPYAKSNKQNNMIRAKQIIESSQNKKKNNLIGKLMHCFKLVFVKNSLDVNKTETDSIVSKS